MALWGDGYVVMALAYALNLRIEVYMPATQDELYEGRVVRRCIPNEVSHSVSHGLEGNPLVRIKLCPQNPGALQ